MLSPPKWFFHPKTKQRDAEQHGIVQMKTRVQYHGRQWCSVDSLLLLINTGEILKKLNFVWFSETISPHTPVWHLGLHSHVSLTLSIIFKIILNILIKEKALKTHTIPYHYLLTARGRLQSEPPLATTKLKNWLDLSGTIIKKQYVPATRWPSSGLQSLAENTITGPVWQSQASRCNFCEDSPLLGLGPCPLDLWLWNFNPNNIILNLSKAIIVI